MNQAIRTKADLTLPRNSFAPELAVKIFVSRKFPRSSEYASRILAAGAISNRFRTEICEVETNTESWGRLNLRSVPAIVYYVDGRCVENIVSYANVHEIQKRSEAVIAAASEGNHHVEEEFAEYVVTNSSGAHRYERWNEWFLNESQQDQGWASPSGARESKEFLEIALVYDSLVSGFWILPRQRYDGTPSIKSLPARIQIFGKTRSDDMYKHIRDIDLASQASRFWFKIEIEPRWVSDIKLVIAEKRDINGKSFPCISGLRVACLERRGNCRASHFRELDQVGGGKELFKTGVFGSENIAVECHYIPPESRFSAQMCNGRQLVIVLDGKLLMDVDGKIEEHKAGRAVVIVAEAVISFTTGIDSCRLLLINDRRNTHKLWEAR